MSADLIALLVAGHRRLESLFAEFETAPSPAQRQAAFAAMQAALARHASLEARFLHPALRQYLPAGPEIAAYEAAEHASFGALEPAVLLDAVRLHMQEEETELFPRLAQACPAAELTRLGGLLAGAGEVPRVTE